MTSRVTRDILDALAAEARARPGWGEGPAWYLVYLSLGQPRLEEAAPPVSPRPGLHAVAYRGEAWCAQARAGTPGAGELLASAPGSRLPGGARWRMVRAVVAVDRAGVTYQVLHFRDTGETSQDVIPPGAGSGAALAAAGGMVRAYLGVSFPWPPGTAPPEPFS